MARIVVGIGVALVALLAVLGWQRLGTFEHEAVAPDVHAIFGLGGNVCVLATERGAVVVDTMTFRMQGQRIRELAERLAGGSVQTLLNTHYHRDHTHGNPGMAPGLPIVATERTREHLVTRDAGYWEGAAAETLPSVLVADEHELRLGGKTIRAIHPGRGHTDGDLVALFVEDRVLCAGDLFFNRRYPRIDVEAGGSVAAWIEALDRVLALDFDRVVPGHGAVSDRSGLQAFQDFLREVWEQAQGAVQEGRPAEDFLATARLTRDAGYESIYVPFVLDINRDYVLRTAFEEARGTAGGS